MSAGKKVRGAATPKSIEVKGPMTNPKANSPKAPSMSNKNSGTSSPSSGSQSATNAGMKGSPFDPKIVVEPKHGHDRNSGSALRGGASRKSSHKDGNRYGA